MNSCRLSFDKPQGVLRSAAMAMVRHRSESIYRRYVIGHQAILKQSATKLAALHDSDRGDDGS